MMHTQFLGEQKAGYTTNIIRNRILPLYKESAFHPYLVATANWVLGEFSSCIPEVSNSLLVTCLKHMIQLNLLKP